MKIKKINRIIILVITILLLNNIPSLSKNIENKIEFYYEENIPKIKIRGNFKDRYTLSVRSLDDKVLYLIAQGEFRDKNTEVYILERKLDREKIKVVYNLNGNVEEKIIETNYEEKEEKDYSFRLLIDSNGEGKNYRRNLSYQIGDSLYDVIYRFFKDNFYRTEYKFDRNGNLIDFQGNENSLENNWITYINNKKSKEDLKDIKLDGNISSIEFYYKIEEIKEEVEEEVEIEEEDKEEIEEIEKPVEPNNSFLEQNIKKPYITGYKDNTFRPNNYGTREEVAKMIYEVLKSDFKSNDSNQKFDFKDVPKDSWSSRYIRELSSLGILTGYKDNTFRPKENITRGEAAVIISRATGIDEVFKDEFIDISSHWSRGYINAMANKGWIKGYEDGSFKPLETVTRAELVTMINRAIKKDLESSPKNKFIDISEENWYYKEVINATN